MDYASSFTFGEAMISADDAKYYAKPQVFSQDDGKTVDRPNFVQVTDKRGTFEGWTLKVKQEKQFSVKDDDTKELTGAQLKFLNGNVTSTIDQQYAPTGQKEITLVPGSAEVAPLAAAKDQGMGTWIYRFGDEQTMAKSIELAVPGTSPKMAKEYVTELTWTLESTPTNTTPSPKSQRSTWNSDSGELSTKAANRQRSLASHSVITDNKDCWHLTKMHDEN